VRTVADSVIGTMIPLVEHLRLIQVEREKFNEERDRRYTEVKNAEEKALKIKEEADKVALDLARQIQTYKDEKANELREQINQERGNYATKEDLKALTEKLDVAIKPLTEFVAASRGGTAVYTQIALVIGVAATVITLIAKFL
jgi:vacuolar-type H+-ATPase subunit E/Vma4